MLSVCFYSRKLKVKCHKWFISSPDNYSICASSWL
jgi:hypothetical protein